MKKNSRFPLFLVLLPLLFFLVAYTENGFFLKITELKYDYLLIYLLIFGSLQLLNLFVAHPKRNALTVFYLAFIYLFFGNIRNTLGYFPWFYYYSVLFCFLLFVAIGFYVIVRKNREFESQVFTYMNCLLIVLCLYQSLIAFQKRIQPENYQLSKVSFCVAKTQDQPSIHLIIWDGYPGFYSLKEHFGYDNSEMKNFLKRNGFFVFDNFCSNYFQTYYSVSSLLNMQYISYLNKVPLNQYTTVLFSLRQISESYMVNFLKQNNYSVSNNSFFEVDQQAALNQNPNFKNTEKIHFKDVFHKHFVKDFKHSMADGRFKVNSFFKGVTMKQHFANQSAIRFLLGYRPKSPHFTFSHLLMPHDPYFTDSLGRIRGEKIQKQSKEDQFIDYLKYTNSCIKKVSTKLLRTDPNSIIILMSDHGYRDYVSSKQQQFKFDNFMALYFPDQNYETLRHLKSNVNIFRVILNQFFGQKLKILPDIAVSIDETKNKIRSVPLKKLNFSKKN